jgi:hypothetical protein
VYLDLLRSPSTPAGSGQSRLAVKQTSTRQRSQCSRRSLEVPAAYLKFLRILYQIELSFTTFSQQSYDRNQLIHHNKCSHPPIPVWTPLLEYPWTDLRIDYSVVELQRSRAARMCLLSSFMLAQATTVLLMSIFISVLVMSMYLTLLLAAARYPVLPSILTNASIVPPKWQ